MKTLIAAITALSVLALAPGLVMAKTINNQLTQSQIDAYCSEAAGNTGGNASFHLGSGRTLTGTVDCANSGKTSLSAANGTDDSSMGSESANDADSGHED